MRIVWSFLKPYKLPIWIAVLLTLVELATELLLPFFLGKMINAGVVNKDIDNIIFWGSIMIGLAFIAFIAGIINTFYASYTGVRFAYDMREKLFAKVQRFSFKNLNDYPASGLVTRFTNDVRQIQSTIFMALRIMFKAPLIAIGGVIMALVVNVRIAFIFLIAVPILVLFLFWVLKKSSKMFKIVQAKVDQVNKVMQENLSGMRLIKAFLRSDHEEKRFMKANKDLASTTRSTFRFVEASMPILLFAMNLSFIFIIWAGHTEIMKGDTSVGDVVSIINYTLRITMAITMLTFITTVFSRGKASAERISDVFDVEVDLEDDANVNKELKVTDGKILFKDVSFTYPNQISPVLNLLNFSVIPGEKLAIIGETGSGKTSLFQLIPRLYDVTAGIIEIDDRRITDYSLESLRSSIGYVPQEDLLFSGTIRDNIILGKADATIDEVIAAATAAQIHETINLLPNQYETKVGQKGVNLSGGQKQRISIARALIRKPKILMLDDSTSALDLTTESKLLDAISKDACTLLIISQKIATTMRADRILVIADGKIQATGTHEQLLKHSELYLEIAKSQIKKADLDADKSV